LYIFPLITKIFITINKKQEVNSSLIKIDFETTLGFLKKLSTKKNERIDKDNNKNIIKIFIIIKLLSERSNILLVKAKIGKCHK